jgi:hypothetical protein
MHQFPWIRLTVAPQSKAEFNRPSSLALAPDDSLYIGDDFSLRIRILHEGIITTFAGSGNSRRQRRWGQALLE